VDAIETRIKDLITSGQLIAGQQLPSERELQDQLNVSRIPLREALARLQALGLIKIRHGKGSFVARNVSRSALSDVLITSFPSFSVERLTELIEARSVLEGELASLATQRATADDLERLRAMSRQNPSAAMEIEAIATADYAFHAEIARIAGNTFLSLMHEAIGPHIRSFIVAYARTVQNRTAAISRNEQLSDAICSGDPIFAAKTAREHLQPCLKSIAEAIKPSDRTITTLRVE
jgi:DNA-binding FadR family transcriptional regulator